MPTGKSLVEDDKLDLAKKLLAEFGAKLVLPVDHVVAAEFKEGAENETVTRDSRRIRWRSISATKTIANTKGLSRARRPSSGTVRWAYSRMPPFDKGTVALAKAVADSGAISVVGGGDSEKAIKSAGVTSKITHVSTGGGASLEFLSGIELPGVAALTDK